MTDPATAQWIALTLALAFTVLCVVLACSMNADDLADAQHEVELDDMWGPDEEWIEP